MKVLDGSPMPTRRTKITRQRKTEISPQVAAAYARWKELKDQVCPCDDRPPFDHEPDDKTKPVVWNAYHKWQPDPGYQLSKGRGGGYWCDTKCPQCEEEHACGRFICKSLGMLGMWEIDGEEAVKTWHHEDLLRALEKAIAKCGPATASR
jgi:hypothetical protein